MTAPTPLTKHQFSGLCQVPGIPVGLPVRLCDTFPPGLDTLSGLREVSLHRQQQDRGWDGGSCKCSPPPPTSMLLRNCPRPESSGPANSVQMRDRCQRGHGLSSPRPRVVHQGCRAHRLGVFPGSELQRMELGLPLISKALLFKELKVLPRYSLIHLLPHPQG